ncbi:MAG: ROK family protein [Candidatus Hodarchaeota archaeon]
MDKYIVGVDIGGTLIRAAICTADLEKKDIKIKTAKTPKEHEYSIINSVILLISELLVDNDINNEDVIGIGLASAGPLDIEKGEVFNSVNLGFKVIPLKEPLEDRFPGIPIYLINDANSAVLGIHYFEAEEQEKDNLVYITMSTGIGGGAICNGHLLVGKDGNAAEIGHTIVEPHSDHQCNCGAYGCWETFSSGTGIKNRALEALETTSLNSKILMFMVDNDPSRITTKEIFQAAKGADKFSKSIIEMSLYYNKIGVGIVNNCYDCTSIYFGGSLLKDRELIIPPLVEQFEKDPIQFTINKPPKIKVTKFLEDIGVRGALVLVKYKLEGNPIIT